MADDQFPEDEGKTRRRPRGSSAATPTAAEARAAQARAGNYVNSRDRLMDRGQAEYNRAVNRDATSMPEPPGGRRTGRGSPSMPAPPSPFGAAANAAGTVARGAARLNPALNAATSSTAAANATLTGTEAGRRLLAEDAARRAGSIRADADMENPMPRPRMGAELRADADMENPAPSVAGLNAVRAAANRNRQNTRPNTRMSPQGMSADDLNEISLATAQRRGGAEMEAGRTGDIARRIAAREMEGMKRGGPVKKMAKGGVVKSSASGRSDGCAIKGKTKGRMV